MADGIITRQQYTHDYVDGLRARHGLIEYFFPKYGELRSEANRRSNPSLAL